MIPDRAAYKNAAQQMFGTPPQTSALVSLHYQNGRTLNHSLERTGDSAAEAREN